MGKQWYSKKITKYISRNNASKLELFLQRNDIDVNDQHFKHRNSMLHLACETGSDIVVRYLLKCGADLMARNKRGQVPLHIACYYAMEDNHQYAETDLILPLIKECPSSLDAVDSKGVTPRMLAASIKNRLQKQYQENTDEEDSEEEDSTSAALSDVDNSSWFNKMAEEAQSEFDDNLGGYTFGEYNEEEEYETFDDWLDRIAKERYAKYARTSFTQSSHNQKSKRTASMKSENYKIPKISDEKQRSFEKKMADAQKELQRGLKERKRLHVSQSKATYERNCDKLFKQQCSPIKTVKNLSTGEEKVATADPRSDLLLCYDDIPWPHASSCDMESVEQFLFGDLEKGSVEYRSYLRRQQVRWHPDRFLHRCAARLVGGQRQRILEKVKALSQLLNRLSQDTRQ